MSVACNKSIYYPSSWNQLSVSKQLCVWRLSLLICLGVSRPICPSRLASVDITGALLVLQRTSSDMSLWWGLRCRRASRSTRHPYRTRLRTDLRPHPPNSLGQSKSHRWTQSSRLGKSFLTFQWEDLKSNLTKGMGSGRGEKLRPLLQSTLQKHWED